MNWYTLLKLAQIQGEWWIDESGNAIFADGDADIESMNHEMIVMNTITNKYLELDDYDDPRSNEFIEKYIKENWEDVVEYMISVEGLISEEERQSALENSDGDSVNYPGESFYELSVNNLVLSDLLKMNGASDEEADVAVGYQDARLYAAKNWGWIRLQGANLEMWSIDGRIMKRAANGLYDAYGDDAMRSNFNLFSYSSDKWFRDVPYVILDSGDVGELRQKQHLGW